MTAPACAFPKSHVCLRRWLMPLGVSALVVMASPPPARAEKALSFVEAPSAVIVTPLLPADEADRSAPQTVALESPLGQRVATAAGESAGRVVDVLADTSGRVRAAVIEFGGFLGVGSKKVAIAWSAIRFNPGAKPSVIVEATREQLRAAPPYRSPETVKFY